MRVFLTGATGFIGRHVSRELRARGHRVTALVRGPRALRDAEVVANQIVAGDLSDEGALREGVRGADAVVHLAGILTETTSDEFRRVNVEGTERVLAATAAAGHGVGRFVHVSSIAAAGPSAVGAPLSEDTPPRPISAYGRSKLASEAAVRRYGGQFPVTVVRPPIVYGPGDRVNLFFARMARRGTCWSVGHPEMPLSVIFATDLARGIAEMVEQPGAAGELFFLSADLQPRFVDLIDAIGRAVGTTPRVRPLPRAVAGAVAAMCQGWGRLSRSTVPLNRDKLCELLAPAWTCTAAKAQERLRWRAAVDYPDGIRATVAWYRERGWLR